MNLFLVSSLLLIALGQLPFSSALPEGCNCRLPAFSRIVGAPKSKKLVPFHVSVQNNGKHICGGVIADENNVITAASCLEGHTAADISVVAGVLRLDEATAANTYKVATINLPEDYDPDVETNNTALLQLSSPLALKDNEVEKACLRIADVKVTKATFQGFGAINKYTVDIEGKINPEPEPSNDLRTASFVPVPEIRSPTHYLLHAPIGDKNVCLFDEGGALHVQENGQTIVVAIADQALMGPNGGNVNLADLCVKRSAFLKLSSIDFFIKKYKTDKFCLV